MKTNILIALSLSVASLFGQTALTQATLSSAVSISANTIVVASASGIVATRTWLYITDPGSQRGELMQVGQGYVSGTRIPVVRGVRGQQVPHISGAYVLIAPAADAFIDFDPIGACTAATTGYTPLVNTVNGNKWRCSSRGMWIPFFGTANSQTMQIDSATATGSANGACVITSPFTKMSGTNACTSFTMPPGWSGQGFTLYPTAAFTGTASNNICKAFTAVADRRLDFAWNGVDTCFTPGY